MFTPPKNSEWLPFRVPIITQHAHQLMGFMRSCGIEPRTFFYPLHRQPAFHRFKSKYGVTYPDSAFPGAIFGYEHGVCLPTFPTLSDRQIEFVAQTVRKFYQKIEVYKKKFNDL